jgi:hypothetical protein
MDAFAAENWVDGSAYGSRLRFLVTPNTTTTATERLGIEQNGLISFGGNTASFPALKRTTTTLGVRLADDSADAPLTASTINATTGFQVGGVAVPVPGVVGFKLTAVNFNTANNDNPITITLPTGFTRFRFFACMVDHPSTTFSTATFGVFSAAAGAGTALLTTSPTTAAFTSTAENTAGNMMSPAVFAGGLTQSFNVGTIYFRTVTANGSAATADVTILLIPVL